MKTTITYDTEKYKMVPIKSDAKINEAWNTSKASQNAFDDVDNLSEETRQAWVARNAGYDWHNMLAAVPDNLPGVVTHSGEPVGWRNEEADDWVDVINEDEIKDGWVPVFLHPAPDALAIIKATLEAAAHCIEKQVSDYDEENGVTDSETGTREYPGDGADWVFDRCELADEIRALNPQAILDSVKI